MQVSVNIFSRGCFYSKELCPSAFTGWLELHGVPFLSHSQFLPGTRSDKPQFDNSAEVRCFTHERPYPCCTTGCTFPSTHFGMGPSIRSKPITALLRNPACPPFCFAQDTVSPELRHSPRRAPNYFLNPTIHHRHQVSGELRGPTLCRQAMAKSELHPDSPVRSSVDMRKEEDPADFPVPFQISCLTRIIRRKNH
jgi:hypothetical protein